MKKSVKKNVGDRRPPRAIQGLLSSIRNTSKSTKSPLSPATPQSSLDQLKRTRMIERMFRASDSRSELNKMALKRLDS